MNRRHSLNLGTQLAASFCGVILLGLLGYFHAVRVLQTSERHSRRTDAIIHDGIAQTKDVELASQQTSAEATEFVYSGDEAYRMSKRQSDQDGRQAFARLSATLGGLPDAAGLLKLTAEARHQDEAVCRPLEEEAMRLAASGTAYRRRGPSSERATPPPASAWAWTSPTWWTTCAAPRRRRGAAEAQAAREAVIGGWLAQGADRRHLPAGRLPDVARHTGRHPAG